jgi:tetratricopeptide (TPR) repeat protein
MHKRMTILFLSNAITTILMNTMPSMPQKIMKLQLRSRVKKLTLMIGLLGALSAGSVFADEVADVSKLMKQGQNAEAMSKADAFLAQKPRDPQMRFLKGVLLTEMNKAPEAILLFAKLTEDFPDLPEPYNNLAVLYAANGQYDKARASLDNAIRTNPSYATAYENLGDIHARLASQAYDKALQLDSKNNIAKAKLTMLLNIGTANNKAVPAPPAPVPVAVVAKPVIAAPSVPTAGNAVQANKPVQVQPNQTAAAVAQVKPVAPVKSAKPVKQAEDEQEDVMKAVNAWAKAWSARDVKAYLDHYANDFQTPAGLSRKAWAEDRKARIQGKGHISVVIETPQVSIDGATATVNFRQVYSSDRLKANSRKILVLVKSGKQWLIKQERSGS